MSKINWGKVEVREEKLAKARAKNLEEISAAVQAHMDAEARQRRYDNILSLCTYATSVNPKFSAEGQAGVQWRDAVWAQCYDMLAQYEAGLNQELSAEEVIASLPAMVWPQ